MERVELKEQKAENSRLSDKGEGLNLTSIYGDAMGAKIGQQQQSAEQTKPNLGLPELSLFSSKSSDSADLSKYQTNCPDGTVVITPTKPQGGVCGDTKS